jgi:hypothetical protein
MKPLVPPLLAAGALAALAGCGDRADQASAQANGQFSAEGKAEPGKISVKGPGVDLTFEVPKAIRGGPKADRNNKIFYPDSTIAGLALVGSQGDGKKQGDSEAEFRFSTPDARDKVAAWYRDPARSHDLRVTGFTKEGDDILVTGKQPGHSDTFKVRLASRPDGGTDGRLVVHHND